jgi:hypothetical protein
VAVRLLPASETDEKGYAALRAGASGLGAHDRAELVVFAYEAGLVVARG